jgi:hypothetical protein
MSKIQRMRELLLALREEHERDGALPTSVRFLFYELVQRGQIPRKAKGRIDRLVSEALMDLRESGQVAWDYIIDETRDLDTSGYRTSIFPSPMCCLSDGTNKGDEPCKTCKTRT